MSTITTETKPAGYCPRCDGCGKIDNSAEGAPWSMWKSLPPGSDAAVRAGLVRPVPCPDCGGSGDLSDPRTRD